MSADDNRFFGSDEGGETFADQLAAELNSRKQEPEEGKRFKVPGFDGGKAVYSFYEDPEEEAGGTAGSGGEPGGSEEEHVSGTIRRIIAKGDDSPSFEEMLSLADEEAESERYSEIMDEDEVSEEEIDALVREELEKRGLLRTHMKNVFDAGAPDEEEEEDVYLGELVSDNDPLIEKLEEEVRKRELEEEMEKEHLSRRERRQRRAALKREEAQRREAKKAEKKRRAESQIEAERRMIAEHKEAEAAARKVVEKRLAKQKRQALRAERRQGKHGFSVIALLLRVFAFLLIFVLAASLMLLTMRMLGKSELINTRITDEAFTQPEGIDGEVLSAKEIVYKGQKLQYNTARTNILFMLLDPEAKDHKTLDSLLLLSLDTSGGKTAEISISADTVCRIRHYGEGGVYKDTVTSTLRRAWALGGGGEAGCENVCDAVSSLLFGIPINAYFALDIRALKTLTDAVGGVEAAATDEALSRCGEALERLSEDRVLVRGDVAPMYLKSYVYDSAKKYAAAEEAGERLLREREYLLGFVRNAIRDTRENPMFPVHLLQYLRRVSYSSLNPTRVVYLVSNLLINGYKTGREVVVPGKVEEIEGGVLYRVKERTLYGKVVRVFYKE